MTDNRTHALYRFYGGDGALLYVGITNNPSNRFTQHAHDKPWWHAVCRIEIETHPTREEVLEAERLAIQAEKPLHNKVHNRGHLPTPQVAPTAEATSTYPLTDQWTIVSRSSGFTKTSPLYLYWEVSGDPMSDDFYSDEISAEQLFVRWLQKYGRDGTAEIYWSLDPICETAPFQRHAWLSRDFLTHFYWPTHAETGEAINFNRLPVVDKLWTPERGDKGGFIQQATGWKPSALQADFDVKQMLAAAGLASWFEWKMSEAIA